MTNQQEKAQSASERAFERIETSKYGPLPERQSPWRSDGIPVGA